MVADGIVTQSPLSNFLRPAFMGLKVDEVQRGRNALYNTELVQQSERLKSIGSNVGWDQKSAWDQSGMSVDITEISPTSLDLSNSLSLVSKKATIDDMEGIPANANRADIQRALDSKSNNGRNVPAYYDKKLNVYYVNGQAKKIN